MSAALNTAPDTSIQSTGTTHPDLSLGSLNSHFSTPGRNISLTTRIPSVSSPTTAASSAPLSTPSPPNPSVARRHVQDATTPNAKRFGLGVSVADHHEDEGEDADGDVLDTPGQDKRWGGDVAAPGRPKRTRSAGSKVTNNLTLRDQEKHIDNLKKENFNIKLKVHFLEERLAQLAPDQIDAALKQNINLKIEVQQCRMEIKKHKKIVLELERELERLQVQQQGLAHGHARERELEEKLEEREREIRELRRRRREEGPGGGYGYGEGDMRELERRNGELEGELDNLRALLEESTEEMERLREMVESRHGHGQDGNESGGGWRRHVDELECENEDLRGRIDELEEMVTRGSDEKEDLVDALEAAKLELEDVQRRREAESHERSQSRAMILEEREEREAVEEDLNAIRDKLAAAQIELQQKEDDLEMKEREIEELVAEHHRLVEEVEEQWRGENDDWRGKVEELRDALEHSEAESKELRMTISEYETMQTELHDKLEATFENYDREAQEKDAEIEAANREIEKLGQQVYDLEEENERLKEEWARIREGDESERERLEVLSAALREKLATYKERLQKADELYEQRTDEIAAHRSKQEELAQHIETLVQELQKERALREHTESSLLAAHKDSEDAARRHARTLEAKESALQSALGDLTRAQALLTEREADLGAVQDTLRELETESRKLGESHTTARFSLQLEADRLRRDVERLQEELVRARGEGEERERKGREREGALDRLHAESRDAAAQLAAQTQARLNVAEKLDAALAAQKAAEVEAGVLRSKVGELETRLGKDQRALLTSETQYRDQLTERNTLLLTIYQYMDRILGVDKTPKKNGAAETKPFTNFGVFHDNLISRLKALSQVQMDFDRRCKEVEGRYAEKLGEMRRQIDAKWKMLDKFEASLKTVAENKSLWRKRMAAKEGEVEALKTTNAELQAAISSGTRKSSPGESMEVRSLKARATNAERRAENLQKQLLMADERTLTVNQRMTTADAKWDARVKEYEARLRVAEEKYKRERQGGKERVVELETQTKSFQRQIELAQKRIQQLNEIIDSAGLSHPQDRKLSPPHSSSPAQ